MRIATTSGRMGTAAVTLLVATAGFATGLDAQQPGAVDTRQPIVLPEAARTAVLHEMRLMLEAVHGVLDASVAMDREAMAEAALSGGTRIGVDRDPAIMNRLPEEFVRLGSSTHRDFDALAAAIRAGASRDSVLGRLSALTAKCVSCHAGYRVVTPDETE